MDPNATLTHLRAMAQALLRQIDGNTVDWDEVDEVATLMENVDELASMVINLDEWLRSGGFLPADWDNKSVGGHIRLKCTNPLCTGRKSIAAIPEDPSTEIPCPRCGRRMTGA